MDIIGISDLHGYLPDNIPQCDVVCICGDISPIEYDRDIVKSSLWFGTKFINWANNLNCKYVVFIAGNHDFFLSRIILSEMNDILKDYPKLKYLYNSGIELNGKTFYGSPNVEGLIRWPFNIDSTNHTNYFEFIPEYTDILLTHTPPKGVNDISRSLEIKSTPDFGSQLLTESLRNKNWDILMCGHIHSGEHNITHFDNKRMVNVSINNEKYQPTYLNYFKITI